MATTDRILQLLDAPQELEALYRQAPEAFRESLAEASRANPDSVALRIWLARRRRGVTITYPGGRKVDVELGASVLEVSRLNAIPHASVCGGRGRCSTCRVRVALWYRALTLNSVM